MLGINCQICKKKKKNYRSHYLSGYQKCVHQKQNSAFSHNFIFWIPVDWAPANLPTKQNFMKYKKFQHSAVLNCLKISRGPIYWDPKNKILVVLQLMPDIQFYMQVCSHWKAVILSGCGRLAYNLSSQTAVSYFQELVSEKLVVVVNPVKTSNFWFLASKCLCLISSGRVQNLISTKSAHCIITGFFILK